MAGPVVLSGMVLERSGGQVVEGCGGCPVMPFVFQYFSGGGGPFVSGNLTWSATAVGGVSPGWRYASGDIAVCPAYESPPVLYLREIVFWCAGGLWQAEIAYVDSGVQFNVSTVTSTLDAFTLFSASSPRSYTTRTPGEGFSFCNGPGHFLLGVVVAA